jgi:hypothetical protein
MTPQQQEFWAELTNNYEYFARTDSPRTFAHRVGRALQGKDEDTTTQVLNHCFPIIMRRRFAKVDCILMLRRWLTEYSLPIAPARIIWFEQFHKSHGPLIKKHTKELAYLDFSG